MNIFITAISIYTLLIFAGGIIGYLTAGSTASIVMSSIFSLGYVMVLCTLKNYPKQSFIFSALLTFFLLAFFCMRYFTTHSFMPGGLMALLSFLMLGIHYISKTHYIDQG
ncbi:MAG: TMEM14 family protein [Chlamydiota bacterium]|nr:TMEM14 family protein [Chlamydiota bacterium]